MKTLWLARLLLLSTLVYILAAWLRSGVIDAPIAAASAAALALVAGVLRKQRRDGMRWALPLTTASYTLGMLITLTWHLSLGLPPGERIAPSVFLMAGIALSLRGIYKATTPERRGRPDYFDASTRSSRHEYTRGEGDRRPQQDR